MEAEAVDKQRGGAVQGLHYLHTGARYAVIHRDIRSSHILLDETWTARLSDFGLSKMGPLSLSKSLTRLESRVVRTQGILARQYGRHGELAEKADVYLFGIILFEVISGKPPYRLWQENFVDGPFPEEYNKYINSAVGSIHRIIDPYLKGKMSLKCSKKFLEIAYCCIYPKASERSSMEEVEVTLAVALELEEKTDSRMEAVNPNGGLVYEVVPFCLSIGENDQVPYQEPELGSGSQWDNFSVENASFL